jgi:hypothetical protein
MTTAEQLEERTSEERDERDDRHDGGEAGGVSIGNRQILTASPLIWILLAAAVAWAGWATVTRGSSSGSSSGTRVVVVPTAGADRMVVALPCSSSGSQGGSARPLAGGSVVVPRDSGDRVVLVPGCKGGSGGAGGGGSGGSEPPGSPIVQVLAPGAPIPKQGSKAPSPSGGSGGGGKVRNVFRVPPSSTSKIIVVTPCSGGKGGSSGGGQQPRTPPSSGRGLLVAPPCSSGQ